MSDIEQNSSPDSNEQLLYEFVDNLSWAVMDGLVTDDNPSRKNGLTGLDQVIMFELNTNNQEYLELIKDMVRGRVADLKGGANFSSTH